MEGQANDAATSPVQGGSPAPQVQPAQTADDGFVRVAKGEWEAAQRHKQQLAGYQPFYEKAKALGFNKPDDLAALEPDLRVMRERGLTPGALARMFGPEAQADLTGGDGGDAPAIDPKAIKAEVMAELKREMAMEEHEKLTKAETDLLGKAVKEILGDNPSEYDVEEARDMVWGYLERNRELYPEGHPLHGERLAPFGDTHVQKAVGHFKDIRAKRQGAAMLATGQAANKKPPAPTPAGQSTGQGKPDTSKNQRKGMTPSREEALEFIKTNRARKGGGGAVSTLGG